MRVLIGTRAVRPCVRLSATNGAAHVQFRLPKRVQFGQTLSLVTSTSGWQPSPKLAMQWSEGDEWQLTADFQPGCE